MRRPDENADEQLLFDLPLGGPERKHPEGTAERKRAARDGRPSAPGPAPELPLPPQVHRPGPAPVPPPAQRSEEDLPASAEHASLGSRFAAGGADLLVHAAVVMAALVGLRLMAVRPALSDWPAALLFLLAFSFLYMVVPLAFWGHTLGMTWTGITSRNRDGEPLTFDQTARRWLGGVLTTATLGLPLLVTGGRRSLTDLLSGSATYPTGDRE